MTYKPLSGFFLSTIAFLFMTVAAYGQSSYHSPIERAQLPKASFYNVLPMPKQPDMPKDAPDAPKQDLSSEQKVLLERINSIYETHVKAVKAEINDDPLDAEKYIMKSLHAVKDLMNQKPGVQKDERFTELYRTVYTEYRSFYGIKKIRNEERGQVFAIKRELFSKNDWMKGKYVLPTNVTKPKTDVPLVYNDKVKRHLEFFGSNKPDVMQKWINRSQKYFPMMKRIFHEEGVPTELIHLSMIESGLNPRARSWASAVGMWQFIRPTGLMYGLKINWWMDERRDPEKSTRAAAQYLHDLYDTWGDWYLAIANYNISPRGLKRAIRADGGKQDYWAAYPYLPRETQGYVPSFIATTIIDRNTKAFGFQRDKNYDGETYSYNLVKVAPLMSLKKLAKAAGISTKKLKNFNPELLRWATPPGSKYSLKIPRGTKRKFVANYRKIPKSERSNGVAVHRVKRGETLGFIARRYGSTVRAIYASNKGLTSTIHPNQKIIVPLAPGSSKRNVASKSSGNSGSRNTASHHRKKRSHSDSSLLRYTVKRGDNIGYIAEWYDVRASQIRNWNRTSNIIHVGDRLKIYVPQSKKNYYRRVNSFSFSKKRRLEHRQHNGENITEGSTSNSGDGTEHYTVQPHDTLIKIARTFGMTVHQLKEMNNLRGSRIYKGQRLTVE